MKTFLFYVILSLAISFKATAQNSDTVSNPVRVSYFNAAQNNNKTRLNWKVICYLNYANFEIQRSSNGVDYVTINSFTADKIRCQSPFDFEDAVTFPHTYYRLKVGDRDGNFSTSKIVRTFGREYSFSINGIIPNLVTSNTLLRISSATPDNSEIAITNLQGMLVKRFKLTLVKGLTELKLNMSDLAKGSYILTVYNSSLERRTARFFKL